MIKNFEEHTESPWVVNKTHPARSNDAEVIIEQKGGSAPIAICPYIHGGQQKANARRIVVCVNICRGYSTDELEQEGIVALVGEELLKQDRLIQSIRERVRDWSLMTPADMKAALSDIEDELASAKLLN
ncbi:hypothetical protein [Shewanella sp. Iso12]|uniref:hypothetical protein n=1 Tax=Shewanella sp. Iso12 TaxID=1826753 RepID=UPI0014313B5E|nr:hypothetical protein [Shewanella sp. Iso12]NJI86911.1 hypothetical protein [Shewanella sp. Iso12]